MNQKKVYFGVINSNIFFFYFYFYARQNIYIYWRLVDQKKNICEFFLPLLHIYFFFLWQIFKKNFNDYIPPGISDKLKFVTKQHTHYVKVVKKNSAHHTHTHIFFYTSFTYKTKTKKNI
jgi:hypothetical protein